MLLPLCEVQAQFVPAVLFYGSSSHLVSQCWHFAEDEVCEKGGQVLAIPRNLP